MNQLAENNNKTFVKSDLEKAYKYFVDYLALNKDLDFFTNALNTLIDPEGFYKEVNRRIKARKAFEEERANFMKESFKEFLSDAKSNELINYLDDNNFIINKASLPEDLPKGYDAFKTFLLEDDTVTFIDKKTQRSFGNTDPRFNKVKGLILEFDELTKPKITEEETKEETKEEVSEEEVSQVLTEEEEPAGTTKIPVINNNIDFNKLPAKLKSVLTSANAQYNSALGNAPEESTRAFQFAGTKRGKEIITNFFNNPDNAADIEKYNNANQPVETPPASVPLTITSQVRQQLYDLGYSKQDVDAMKPEEAQDIIANQTTKPKVEEPVSDIERRNEDLDNSVIFLFNDGTYGGSKDFSLREYLDISEKENGKEFGIDNSKYINVNGTGVFINRDSGQIYIVPNNTYNKNKPRIVKLFFNKGLSTYIPISIRNFNKIEAFT
jgi:hypothetical protein